MLNAKLVAATISVKICTVVIIFVVPPVFWYRTRRISYIFLPTNYLSFLTHFQVIIAAAISEIMMIVIKASCVIG